jgi:hypothetical protein
MSIHPHRIDPIIRDERRRSRNCLRVDYISDGIEPRCNLRPKDEQGQWVLDNRPHHLREMIELFDYCINDAGCDQCRIARRAYADTEPPFIAANIRVYARDGRMVVTTLGQCTWYDIYAGADINAVAAWVKARGGALGAHGQDAWGRYREGFVNGYQISRDLWPPHVERAAVNVSAPLLRRGITGRQRQ